MGTMGHLNLVLRFALELAMLFAFGYWGFTTGGNLMSRIALGAGGPVVAIAVWGMLIAPRTPRLLRDPGRLVLEVALFGLAVAALIAVDRPQWASVLAVVTVANIGLLFVFDQR